MKILWRDDDCNVYTDAFKFKELHEQFIAKNQVHTVAVLMKDLWQNHALFYYLATAPLLEIGLHGWEHKDYSKLSYKECYEDLKKSLDYWFKNVIRMLKTDRLPAGKNITTFFVPWNKSGVSIELACKDIGLQFCNVRKGEWNGYEVKSFHFWNLIIDGWKLNL